MATSSSLVEGVRRCFERDFNSRDTVDGVNISCIRHLGGNGYDARVLIVVRARTKKRPCGERGMGQDRVAALRVLCDKLQVLADQR